MANNQAAPVTRLPGPFLAHLSSAVGLGGEPEGKRGQSEAAFGAGKVCLPKVAKVLNQSLESHRQAATGTHSNYIPPRQVAGLLKGGGGGVSQFSISGRDLKH